MEALDGYAVVMGAARPVADLWGREPEALDLMRAIKAQWDPAGGFNVGCLWCRVNPLARGEGRAGQRHPIGKHSARRCADRSGRAQIH